MADHGYLYEERARWQRMFGTSVDSVEWSARDALKESYAETVTCERSDIDIRVLCTGNGGRSPPREFLRAHFDGGLCDKIWIETEPVVRHSVRKSRWNRG